MYVKRNQEIRLQLKKILNNLKPMRTVKLDKCTTTIALSQLKLVSKRPHITFYELYNTLSPVLFTTPLPQIISLDRPKFRKLYA